MNAGYVHSYEARIRRMFDAYARLPEDDEVQAHWAKYRCIQTSGVLEVAIRSMLADCARSKAETRVGNYVDSKLAYFTNAKTERIEKLLGRCSKSWSEKVSQGLTDTERDAINSIVGNRHNIAHGRDVGITFGRIKEYYDHAARVLERLRVLINS